MSLVCMESLMVGDSATPSLIDLVDGLRVLLTIRIGSFLCLLACQFQRWVCLKELDIVFRFEQTDDLDE